jgi:nucleoside-diphosphate kinase
MAEAEVHFIAVSENCETVGKISQVASSHGLSLGKVRTCVSDYFENGISAQRGDNVSELVGVIVGFNHDKFSADINCIEGTQVHLANAAQTDSIFKSTRSNFQVNPLDDCSLCILKPHVLKDKKAGLAIEAIIEAGFGIESMYAVHMNVNVAEHLLEVYRGIHPSFTKMMEHMVSGPVLGLLVSSKNGNTVEELREFAGPLEPKLAHKLRPKSLRGKLGIDLARNVIQCTDLPEDGGSECDFFFNVLASLN